jgi:thiol-disulfide isomerase/thioredoxin
VGNFNKKNIIRFAVILFVIIILAASTFILAVTAKNNEISAASSEMASYQQASEGNKPMVILFYAPWCSYCKNFEPKYKTLSKEYENKYTFIMVDGEDFANRNLTIDYAIGSYPTLYIIDPVIDNRILISNTLYGDINKIKTELDRYLRIRARIKK